MRQDTFVRGSRSPGLTARVAAVALLGTGLTLAGGLLAARWLFSAEESAALPPPAAEAQAPALFRDWPADRKPDLALVLSGQEHGYLQPCGCSRPQLGGLVRRYNFIQGLKQRGWPVVAVDLGDVVDHRPHKAPEEQLLLKYQTSMNALGMMGYLGTSLGLNEAEMTLHQIIAAYALNAPEKNAVNTLAANLVEKYADTVKSWVVGGGQNGEPSVGVVSLIGPTVTKSIFGINQEIKFADNKQVLPAVLQQIQAQKKKPDLLVLLYQGTADEARACAVKFPQFHVILHLTTDSEPSGKAERVGDTLLIGVGHKGRYVGVVGVYRTGQPKKPFELRYQLAALGEEYVTPAGKEATHPIMGLMEKYAQEVKDRDFLSQYPQRKHPLQAVYPNAKYVGSENCKECHEKAYSIWQKTPHAHAYHSLVTAKDPGLRQFDGECVMCHVVGFGYQTGFASEKKTPQLKDVGCESCHGPGSLHVQGDRSARMLALMNPFRPKAKETAEETTRRLNLIDQSCQQCHDQDNDVHWDFKKKWPRIIHHED